MFCIDGYCACVNDGLSLRDGGGDGRGDRGGDGGAGGDTVERCLAHAQVPRSCDGQVSAQEGHMGAGRQGGREAGRDERRK